MTKYRKWVISLKTDHFYNYKDDQVLLFYLYRSNQKDCPGYAMQIKNKIAKKLLLLAHARAAHFINEKSAVLDKHIAEPKLPLKNGRLDYINPNCALSNDRSTASIRKIREKDKDTALHTTNRVECPLHSKAVQSTAINSMDALFQGPLLAVSICSVFELVGKDNKSQLLVDPQITARSTDNYKSFFYLDNKKNDGSARSCKRACVLSSAEQENRAYLLLGGLYKGTLYNPIQLQRLALLEITIDRSSTCSDLESLINPVQGYYQKLCMLLKIYISQLSQLCQLISKGSHKYKDRVLTRQSLFKNGSLLHLCFQSKIVMLIRVLHARKMRYNPN